MTTDAIEELSVADALATYETNQKTRNGNGNRSESQSNGESVSRRTMHTARGCTYKEFLNCRPLNFKVKYATCNLLNGALTWWNSHVRAVGHDAAYEMSWKDLMKMMTEAYCPRNEIQKLESEIVPDEADKVKRLQEAIQFANSLMDQKVRAYAARQADNQRRMDNNPRDNHAQEPPYKR
ncbi:hypothetical protein Tco_1347134 [Tanacetum coccineum]